ncbi:hypothetical protein, partial [Catenulispora pinisilvae]|uniref:hypothetical protein n=1 Tax=Catenulispora pinisilvae TaxID=2705253 RepID=UPI001E426C78
GTTPARTVPKGHKTFISRGTPHHEATTYTSAPIHVRDTLDLALDLAWALAVDLAWALAVDLAWALDLDLA